MSFLSRVSMLAVIVIATATSTAQAAVQSWSYTVPTWPIKAYGPRDVTGQGETLYLDRCPINPNWTVNSTWGCPASDDGYVVTAKTPAGVDWPYVKCGVARRQDSGPPATDELYLYAMFYSGHDANGFATWPADSNWPTSVTCTKTLSGGFTHTFVIPISSAPAYDRVILPVSIAAISLTAGSSITVPAVWNNAGRRYFNIPNGNYTGPSALGVINAKRANGTVYPDVKCAVGSSTDDWLVVAAHESSANGTAYCPVTKDGTNYSVPFIVTTP